jgi:hypothetical protein
MDERLEIGVSTPLMVSIDKCLLIMPGVALLRFDTPPPWRLSSRALLAYLDRSHRRREEAKGR